MIKETVKAIKRSKSKRETLCPICNKERVSKIYNLLTEYPVEAGEWYYPLNGGVTPFDISPKSSMKVWWICRYNHNHIWYEKISNRTLLKRGCPKCAKKFKISFPARAIYFYLNKIYEDCEIEYKKFNKYTADICLVNQKIVIEYDGWYFHSSKEAKENEKRKDKLIKDSGYEVIRIKDRKKKMSGIKYKNNVVEYHLMENKENLNELIRKMIVILASKTKNFNSVDIDIKRDFYKIEDLYYHIKKANSLAVKRPDLVKEYSNDNIESPDNISLYSSKKVKWICTKCNNEYWATVQNRTKNNSGCQKCAIERRKKFC